MSCEKFMKDSTKVGGTCLEDTGTQPEWSLLISLKSKLVAGVIGGGGVSRISQEAVVQCGERRKVWCGWVNLHG